MMEHQSADMSAELASFLECCRDIAAQLEKLATHEELQQMVKAARNWVIGAYLLEVAVQIMLFELLRHGY